MLLRQFFDPDSSTYTYLLAARPGGEALLIDPVRERVDEYAKAIEALGAKLAIAVDTHTHADHFTGLGTLREHHGCVAMMGRQAKAECVSARFADGERLKLDGLPVRARYTPGHTDDSYSFVVEGGEEATLFSGDTLLIGGTGRTDFQNGDPHAAYRSLFEVLLRLPDDTRVYPGHDYHGRRASTIGEERRSNPRLQMKSAEAYAALMGSLKLPNPKLMDVAVAANLRCGMA